MLTAIHPKLPMRDKSVTRNYYVQQLGFKTWGHSDHSGYLMLEKDGLQLHFFLHPDLNPLDNDGQVYLRTDAIEALYASLLQQGVSIHPNGALELKPWGQKEFSLLDPDHNLLTFGETV